MTNKTKDNKGVAFINVNGNLVRKDSILKVFSHKADSLIDAKDRIVIGITDGSNILINFESMKDANKAIDEMATLLNVEKTVRFE